MTGEGTPRGRRMVKNNAGILCACVCVVCACVRTCMRVHIDL